MLRKSVNDLRSDYKRRKFSDRISDIAEAFLTEIRITLGEKILPETFGKKFKKNDAPLYVNKRHWIMSRPEPRCPFSLEEYLHSCFWPTKKSQGYTFIVLKGKEGVGKSTFLRYYCDCYLPWYHEFDHERVHVLPGPNWSEEVDKHIFLYVDLHPPVANLEKVLSHIFETFRRSIDVKFPQISVEDNYAMWARVARWDDPARRSAEDITGDKQAYRLKWVDQQLDNNELFVEEALWYLNAKKVANGSNRFFITQVYDNIDLLDFEIQKELIQHILGWIKHKRCQWKVIVTLRPQTLSRLNPVLGPILDKEIIEVGSVDLAVLLNARGKDLDTQMLQSGKQVERDRYVKEKSIPHGTIVFQPMSNFRVRECMRRILGLHFGAKTGQNSLNILPHPYSEEFVVKFCNGSIRRFLRLMQRLLASTPMQRAAEQQELHRGEQLPHYIFLSSLLTGPRDYFDADDEDNDILNLFQVIPTNQEAPAYSLMVGIHVMYLLLQKQCFKKSDVIRMLTKIGYTQEELEECLETMYGKGFFGRDVVDLSGDYRIDLEDDVFEAYRRLVQEEAYIDNMALVTPVEDSLVRKGRMSHTTSYAIGQFKQRVSTSLLFLQQIRDDEIFIRTWRQDSPRYRMTKEAFVEGFKSLNIPSIYRKATHEYLGRLKGLREEPGHLAEVMTERHWNRLIRDSIFEIDEKLLDAPLEAILHDSPQN